MRAPQGYESLDLSNGFDYGSINMGDLIVICDHDAPTDITAFEVHNTSHNRAGVWLITGRDHEGVRCTAEFSEHGTMPAEDDLLAVYTPIPGKQRQYDDE